MIKLDIQLFGGRGASSSNSKNNVEKRLKGYKELKSVNSDNLSVGDKLLMRETTYDLQGNVEKEYFRELEVVRDNSKTFGIKDNTLNVNFNLQKNYEFGKINLGERRRYYKK